MDSQLRAKNGKFAKIRKKRAIKRCYIEVDHNYVTAHLCNGPADCTYPECTLRNEVLGRNVSRTGWREGRRLVEFDVLLSGLRHCKFCNLGPVPLTEHSVVGELQRGLGGYLYVKCDNLECRKTNIVPYGKVHRDDKAKGMPKFVANTKLGLAMIDGLGGPDKVNNFLSTLNLKTISKKNLKVMERRAGKSVEAVAEKSTLKACEESFRAEMKHIAEQESGEAHALMLPNMIDTDLGLGILPDASPSVRKFLARQTYVDGVISGDEELTCNEDASPIMDQLNCDVGLSDKVSSPFTPANNSRCLKSYVHQIGQPPRKKPRCGPSQKMERAKTKLDTRYRCKTRTGMSCAVDTAWHKRGFDSLTSHTFLMSKKIFGKKVVKTMITHRTCATCKWWQRNRPFQKVRKHRCVFNHRGSARSMESASGVQAVKELSETGYPVEILEGDGDNTLIARLAEENIYVKKKYDKNHVVKNIGKQLYSLQKTNRKLTKSVIAHIQKCIKYAFAKNQGSSEGLKTNLTALVPHQFGDHSLCEAAFCGSCRDKSQKYKHLSLPYKVPLKDEQLRQDLLRIMKPVIDNSEAYSDLGCSQQCEHANREVTLRVPKMLHYGNSEALDFKVKATAAFINEGRQYITQVNEEASISPGKFTQEYAQKQMKRRKMYQDRAEQPAAKRRRMILRQERAMVQSSCEVLEGQTYESGVGLQDNPDIERIPDAIPRPNYRPVDVTGNESPTFVAFDLETTDLIRGRHFPQLTQIAATEMTSGAVFSCYVKPRIPISDGAKQVTGISVSQSGQMTVKGKSVDHVHIKTALSDFSKWLGKFSSPVLVAHNGKRFDFPVFFRTVEKVGVTALSEQIIGLIDSLSLFKKYVPDQCSYKQEDLVKSILSVSLYDAHNAIADVKYLAQLVDHLNLTPPDIMKFSFRTAAILHSLKSNKEKYENIDSLRTLVAAGVMKNATAENIASSGLNFSHLKKIYERDGEDGLMVVFTSKNSESQPRVTSVKRTLETVIPKLAQYFKNMSDIRK